MARRWIFALASALATFLESSALAQAQDFKVYFTQDSAALSVEALDVISQAAARFREVPRSSVITAGHTDTLGSRWHNLRLSKRRAKTVARELHRSGVPWANLIIRWSGETNLPHETEDGMYEPLNRTVTVSVDPR